MRVRGFCKRGASVLILVLTAAPHVRAEAPHTNHQLVQALVNRNSPPKLVGDGVKRPVFDPEFDWDEYDRVWKAIPALVRAAEQAWPELVRHLDDEQYCTTCDSITGYPYNFTVGDMCRRIIGSNLSAAYYQHLKPEQKVIYGRFAIPEIARDKKQLQAWCEQRKQKRLYELQIEACEWAIAELSKPDEIRGVPSSTRQSWIVPIEAQIESLRRTRQAVHFPTFGEAFTPYSREQN